MPYTDPMAYTVERDMRKLEMTVGSWEKVGISCNHHQRKRSTTKAFPTIGR